MFELNEWMVLAISVAVGFFVALFQKFTTLEKNREVKIQQVSMLLTTGVKGAMLGVVEFAIAYFLPINILEKEIVIGLVCTVAVPIIAGKDIAVVLKDRIIIFFKLKFGLLDPDEKQKLIDDLKNKKKELLDIISNKELENATLKKQNRDLRTELETTKDVLAKYIDKYGELEEEGITITTVNDRTFTENLIRLESYEQEPSDNEEETEEEIKRDSSGVPSI